MLLRHMLLQLLTLCFSTMLVYFSNDNLRRTIENANDDMQWIVPHGAAFEQLYSLSTSVFASFFIAIPAYFCAYSLFLLIHRIKYRQQIYWVLGGIALVLVLFELWVVALVVAMLVVMLIVLTQQKKLKRHESFLLVISIVLLLGTAASLNSQSNAYRVRDYVMAIPYAGPRIVNFYYQYNFYAIAAVGHIQHISEYSFEDSVKNAKRSQVRPLLELNSWIERAKHDETKFTLEYLTNDQWAIHNVGQVYNVPQSHLVYRLTQLQLNSSERQLLIRATTYKLICIFALGGVIFLFMNSLISVNRYRLPVVVLSSVLLIAVVGLVTRVERLDKVAQSLPGDCITDIPNAMTQQPIYIHYKWVDGASASKCQISESTKTWLKDHSSLLIKKRLLDLYFRDNNLKALRQAFENERSWYLQQRARQLISRIL